MKTEQDLEKEFPDVPWGRKMTLQEAVDWKKRYLEQRGKSTKNSLHVSFDNDPGAMEKEITLIPRFIDGNPVIGIRNLKGEVDGFLGGLD